MSSSTSWTKDEDFGLLLHALVLLNDKTANMPSFPSLVVVVTGKGPEKAMYLKKIAALKFVRIQILTLYVLVSTVLSIDRSFYLSFYRSSVLSIVLAFYHSIYLSLYESIYRSITRSIYLSVYLSVYLSIYRSIYLSN